jgi:hypothetical protein
MTSVPRPRRLNRLQTLFYPRNYLIVKNNVIWSFFHQTDMNAVKHR